MSRGVNTTRSLHFEDNLAVLATLPAGSIDLAYLDPPFNSGRAYETVLPTKRDEDIRVGANAFDDRWSWSDDTEQELRALRFVATKRSAEFVASLASYLGRNALAAYLVYMAPRFFHVHRVLSERGSLYTHCDPSASHYLKVLLDHIFGGENFRNEIVWRRTHAHSGSRRYGPIHDVILFYSKSQNYAWNPTYTEYREDYIDKHFRQEDERGRYQLITCTAPGDRTGTKAHYEWRGQWPPPGRHWAWRREQMEEFEREGKLVYSSNGVPRLKRYIDDGKGVPVQDLWLDIPRLDAHSDERVGFETQKPMRLLERMILASSSPGDVVLDPFCGSGTALVAAERLKRGWIGIDNSFLACALALGRARQEAGTGAIKLHGFPESLSVARRIRKSEPTAFGIWAASMLATVPARSDSRDGLITGLGRLRVRRRPIQVASWVPLTAKFEPRVLRLGRHSGAKVGFVLRGPRGASDLEKWISARMRLDALHVVEVVDLVDAGSVYQGIAPRVLEHVAGVA